MVPDRYPHSLNRYGEAILAPWRSRLNRRRGWLGKSRGQLCSRAIRRPARGQSGCLGHSENQTRFGNRVESGGGPAPGGGGGGGGGKAAKKPHEARGGV